MNKRKSSDLEDKENDEPNSQNVKKLKADFLDEKLDKFSSRIDAKIEHLENIFQANVERLEQIVAHEPSNKNLAEQYNLNQDVKLPYLVSNFDPMKQAEEFMNLLLNSKQLGTYFKNNDQAMLIKPYLCLSFFDLIKLSELFSNDELMTEIKNYIVQNLKPDELKELLSVIKKDFAKLRSSNIVYELIEHRIKWINEYCTDLPVLNWKMPNPVFVGEQKSHEMLFEIREFLRSGQIKKILICGNSLEYARKLIKKFFKEPRTSIYYQQKGYSLTMQAAGAGQSAHILMTKNEVYFNEQCRIYATNSKLYKEEKKELENFRDFYTKFIRNEEGFFSSNDATSESNDVSNHTSLLQNNYQVAGSFSLTQNPSGNQSNYPANLIEEANIQTLNNQIKDGC